MSKSLARMVKACFQAHTPVLLEGEPGLGKTAFAHGLAKEIGGISIAVCLSHKEATEVHGIPIVSRHPAKIEGREITCVVQAPPAYVQQALATDKPVIILLDELSCLPPMTQAPVLAILSESVIAELHLPRERVAIMAAANPPALAAGGWSLPAPMANRLVRLPFKVDAVEWSEAFPLYWGAAPSFSRWGRDLPENAWAQKRSLIAAFIRSHPDHLLNVPKEAAKRSGPWPSPRTCDYVSRHLVVAEENNLNEKELRTIIAGTVGEEWATRFMQWQENMDLGDPRDLVDHPEQFKLPPKTHSDKLYYLIMGMCAEIVARRNKAAEKESTKKSQNLALTSWNNGWKVLELAIKAGGARDIAAIGANYLAQRDHCPAGAKPPAQVDTLVPIIRAAGVDWSTQGKT